MPKYAKSTVSDSDGKLRIPKACEECRRRKQKCNGLLPCNICARRGSQCKYRSFLRNRASKASLALRRSQQNIPQTTTTDSDNLVTGSTESEDARADVGVQPVPLRGRIFNNVRASHAPPDSPSGSLELYYGPSSNFSFLQHIHSHLTTRQTSQSIDEANDDTEGIDRFKYKGIVFGSVRDQGRTIGPIFLRYELAKSFLQNYLSTTHHFMPLLDTERLCSTFEKLYGPRSKGDSIDPLDKAAVIITMAMGAMSTEEDSWRDMLLTQARAEAESVRYHVNVNAIKITVLMAHYEFATGHPNLAYLCLGNAVTKALAAGIHKEGRGSGSRPEASQTMWTLFCNESISCLMFGRPFLLDQDIITIPVPERPSPMAAFVQLCMTIRRTHRMYSYHESLTISGLVESANSIHRELLSFADCVKEDFGVVIGGLTCPMDGAKLTRHIVGNYLYFYTMTLAFRPLLLLQVELERLAEEVTGVDSRPKPSHHRMPLLLEARGHCIDAARSTISFSESILSTVRGAQAISTPPKQKAVVLTSNQGLCNHGYFLEGACFVLVLAAVNDCGPVADSHIQYVNRGLECLRKLVQREPVPSVVAALERMMEKLRTGSVLRDQSAISALREGQRENVTVLQPESSARSQVEEGEMSAEPFVHVQQNGVSQHGSSKSQYQDMFQNADIDDVLDDLEWPNINWNVDLNMLDIEEFVSVMGSQPGFPTSFDGNAS